MKKYRIENQHSGVDMGIFDGETEEDALDAMARDAGYADYAEACEVTGQDQETSGLVVTEESDSDD